MRLDAAYFIRHSTEFVERWRDIVSDVFGWKIKDDCCLIPSLFRARNISSYLPCLSYTDLNRTQAEDLFRRLKESKNDALIKAIAEKDSFEFIPYNHPVVMRLPLEGFNQNEIWEKFLFSVCRNRIRKGLKQNYQLVAGTEDDLINDAYGVYRRIMHRLGTPVWPKKLLLRMCRERIARVYTVYRDVHPVAMLVLVLDDKIAWVPWCGALTSEHPGCPNHLTHWSAIEHSIKRGCSIFDFGRSPYGSSTYEFKRKWGATPIPLTYFSSPKGELYAKYKLAAAVWKRIPAHATDLMGPFLYRYLSDI